MTETIFFDSVEEAVTQRLLPVAQRLLETGNEILGGRFPMALSVEDSCAFDMSVSKQGPKGADIHLTRGVLFRLCFAAQVFIDAFMAAKLGTRVFHATFIEPAETAFIGEMSSGLTGLNFALCEPLRAVFTDGPSSRDQWDQLRSLKWTPLGFAESGDSDFEAVCLSQRSLSDPAMRLALLALSFLIFHEFAHVRLGHLHFLEDTTSLRAYPERGVERLALDADTFKALEIDADIEALRLLLTVYGKADPQGDPADLFCAVGVVLTLFDLTARSSVHYQAATHPLPDFRYILSANYWGKNLGALALAEKFSECYRQGWQEGLLWCKTATDQMGLHAGAFYCVDREIFVATDSVSRFRVMPAMPGSLAQLMMPRDGSDFTMVNFADKELAGLAIALTRIRPLLLDIQKRNKLGDD